MDYTELILRLRENSFEGARKPGKVIVTGNKDIFDATVFQIIEYRRPEAGTLACAVPYDDNFFLALHVYP